MYEQREAVAFGTAVLGIVAGVAVLLYGEATHGNGSLVPAGGVLALLGVALLTGLVARL